MVPPLNALRAFEVAARCGSFTRAGEELGVSSAAISLQVRQLEDHLGKRLFLRQGNRLSLTAAGLALQPRLGAAFAEIAAVTGELRDGPPRRRFVLSVLPSLAECWLPEALAGAPLADLAIRVEDDPVDFTQGPHLRLTYGGQAYPAHAIHPLFQDEIVAVSADGAADRPIHIDWGAAYPNEPDWATWAAAAAQPAPDRGQGLVVPSTVMALSLARAGLGAALAPRRLVAADLAAGRLRLCAGPALPMRQAYVAIHPVAMTGRRPLAALLAHFAQLSVPEAAAPSNQRTMA